MRRYVLPCLLAILTLAVSACGGEGAVADDSGIRLASADHAARMLENAPAELVVLDVRTPEEFGEGHLPDAEMLDFYRTDFADRLGELDRDLPYLIYCRSGNRSGQTRAIMSQLGFIDVVDVDGGIGAWLDGGHPYVTG